MEEWTNIPTTANLTWGNLNVTIDSLMAGEYAIGIKRYQVDVPSFEREKCEISIVPNPVASIVSFVFDKTKTDGNKPGSEGQATDKNDQGGDKGNDQAGNDQTKNTGNEQITLNKKAAQIEFARP